MKFIPDRAFTKAHMCQISECVHDVGDLPERLFLREDKKIRG